VYAYAAWRDNYPTTVTGNPRLYRRRANVDLGGGYRLTPRHSLFFSARKLFNEPYRIMEQDGAIAPVVQFYKVNGTNWTFGIKGTY